MTTATSSFNLRRFLKCYKDTLWRNKNSGLIYLVLSFIALPLQYIMSLSTLQNRPDIAFSNYLMGVANCYTDSALVMFTGLTLGAAVFIPMQMLSYMHNKRAVDVYHSLPFSRVELLGSNILAGLTYIVVPIILNFSVIAAVSAGQPFGLPMETMFEALFWCVAVLATFSLVVFVSTMVGTLFDTFIFSILLDFSLLIFYGIFVFLGEGFLAGFDSQHFFLSSDFYYLSPSLLWVGRQTYNPQYGDLKSLVFWNMAWFIFSLLFLALAFFIYQKRDSEKAESSTDRGPLSIYSRIVGTFGGGLLLGLLFAATMQLEAEEIPLLVCIFAGSIITYFVGDIIIAKHVRKIKKAFIPSLCYSVAICLVVSAFMFDFFGFEKKIPSIDSIKSVSLDGYDGRFNNQPTYLNTPEDSIYYTPEAIKAVHDYHKFQVDAIGADEEDDYYYGINPRIIYTLNSGKTVYRQYRFGIAAPAMLDFEACDEFIIKNNPIFKIDPAAILKITTLNATGNEETELKLNHTQAAALLEALKQDMLEVTPDDLQFSKMMGKVNLYIPKERVDNIASPTALNEMYYAEEKKSSYNPETPETITTNVIVTDKFKNTLAFIKSVNYEAALDGNLDAVKTAYIGVDPYNDDRFIKYVAFHHAYDLQDQVNRSYSGFTKLTQSDLEVLKASLSPYAFSGTPSAIVAFSCDNKTAITDGNDIVIDMEQTEEHNADVPLTTVTGYAFVDFNKLPPKLQKVVLESGYESVGNYSMKRAGFPSPDSESEIQNPLS